MYRLTRAPSLAAVTLIAMVLNGCATVRVNSYLERGADFRQYRTYAWGPADAFSTGDPRLDNNRFFSERVEKAVDQQLASRGFEKRESGASDVLIHVHARIDQRIESDAIDREATRAATSPTAGRLSTRLARCSSISSTCGPIDSPGAAGPKGF